ncbi:MAG TPA: transposase [Gammaproteobacteria bacterium]|nr:transposase [Gammaproteobacteria bacterium]
MTRCGCRFFGQTSPYQTLAADSRSPIAGIRFKEAMRWRTGCEGRISVLKRRHGLNRSRYKGSDGMKRWVGIGVIADNVINIARAMTAASNES